MGTAAINDCKVANYVRGTGAIYSLDLGCCPGNRPFKMTSLVEKSQLAIVVSAGEQKLRSQNYCNSRININHTAKVYIQWRGGCDGDDQ